MFALTNLYLLPIKLNLISLSTLDTKGYNSANAFSSAVHNTENILDYVHANLWGSAYEQNNNLQGLGAFLGYGSGERCNHNEAKSVVLTALPDKANFSKTSKIMFFEVEEL
ncbi:hypothetical protein ACJX0J_016142, partial [Zea mays]